MNPADSHAPPLPDDDPCSPENIARRQALGIAERDAQGRLLPGSVLPGAGRKPDGVAITALARVHTAKAVRVLADVMEDPKAPPAAKVAAAQALLDRGWGRSPVTVDIQVRARFDDFLRDVGIAAVYQHDHPAALPDALIETLGDIIEAEVSATSENDA